MASDDFRLIKQLEEHLVGMNKVAYFNSAQSELITRCPYCGDSSNNERHGHFYISTSAPFMFHCFRCETSGILSNTTLNDLDVGYGDLSLEITKASKKALKREGIVFKDDEGLLANRRYRLPEYNTERPSFSRKVEYLEDRFGVKDLDLPTLRDIGFVANISDVIEENRLKRLKEFYLQDKRHTSLRKHLNLHSVGFATTDRNFITFRYMEENPYDKGRRYYMENLNRPINIGHKIFTISNTINSLTPALTVVMAEGIMDLSSIFINLFRKEKREDIIFMAVNGKSFLGGIKVLRRMGFLDINLEMYSDSDVSLNHYKYSLIKGNEHYFNKIRVHYNIHDGEKDFGVPLSRIKEKIYKLK